LFFLIDFNYLVVMAKVNNTDIYKFDLYPSLMDFLLGSNFENNKKTQSYRLNSIIQLINGVNGKNNLQFLFSDGTTPEVDYFTKGVFFTDNNETNPSNFTKLILNKESLQPIILTLLFERLAVLENVVIKLDNPENPNNFFNFKIKAIQNQTEYFVFDVEILNNFYFGELLNDTIYSLYFDVKSDSQDNIKKELLISCPDTISNTVFATIINQLPSFTVLETEIPTFKSVSNDLIPITYYVELLNTGKGDYGVGGTVLTASNIKITSFGATSTDIGDLPTTQIIDLGYEGDDVVTALNRQLPNIVIQDQNEGYVIIKGIFESGEFHEYLWIGTGGTYGGSGGLQSTVLDFKELSNPVVYTKQETDDLLNGKLDKGTYTGNAGLLDERITDLEQDKTDLPFFNKIISETGFSLTGQELKINPLWRWMLANVNYSNPTEVKIPIPFCAPGKSRIDYVVPNTSNGFDRVAGVESDTIPVAPPIPNEGIYVTFFVVTDGAIDEPANPNPANTPSLKEVTAIGAETERAITVLEPGVRGIDIDCETLDFWIIDGLRKSIRMIWTNIANGYDIRFPAKPEGSQEVFAMVSDFEDYYTKPEIDSKISSVYRSKGNVANFAALPTTGLTIGDVYNVLDTGDNYVWTGTLWDKLSGIVDLSGKEDNTNKTEVVVGNETSITKYLNIKGVVDYFQQKLTDSVFGTFINSLTSKVTPVDADIISIVDSADGNKQKKVSLTNFKVYLKTWISTIYPEIANQVEVTTSQNAQASWHGKTVFFQANVTITIPATGFPSGYTFEGVTEPACSVSWAITTPKVWALGTPAATPEKSIFTLMQLMSNSNKIYLFGL
jgi:hypothetical protein